MCSVAVLEDEDLEDLERYIEWLRHDICPKLKSSIIKLNRVMNKDLGYRVRISNDVELMSDFLDFITNHWIRPSLELDK